jgi:maltose O-acetyltransferase
MTAPEIGPEQTGRPRALGVPDFVRRLAEDADEAARHLWLNTLGGSGLLPRTVRRLLYSLAGARMASPPGSGSTIIGHPRLLSVARNVYFNRGVFIEAYAPVTIGEDCAVGMEVMIVTSHHPVSAAGRWDKEADPRPVTVGDRVWIGARSVILPGARIESDVVIAAGAVVVGPCLTYGLYAGVPARRVKELGTPAP